MSSSLHGVSVAEVLSAFARVLGRTPIAATPDAICELAAEVSWTPVTDWESSEDTDLACATGLFSVPFTGDLLVVSEHSLTSGRGGVLIASSGLEQFVKNHLKCFGECFFNGDVLIVESEGRLLWLFHHEGAYSLIE